MPKKKENHILKTKRSLASWKILSDVELSGRYIFVHDYILAKKNDKEIFQSFPLYDSFSPYECIGFEGDDTIRFSFKRTLGNDKAG